MLFNLYTPPNPIIFKNKEVSLFLAGTIDNGAAVDWQKEFVTNIQDFTKKYKPAEFTYASYLAIYNPRRPDWNPNTPYTYTNADMYQQINWEMKALKHASYIIFNFLPNSDSMISLLELGLYADSGKILAVCCPDEYKKSANVHAVCDEFKIPLIKNFVNFFV